MRAPTKVASAFRGLVSLLLLTTCPIQLTLAYDLDPNSTESVTSTAKKMASDMLSFYNGDKPGGTPGLLPDPYYWWEAGAMFGALIEYWYYTKDETYVDMTIKALLFQIGKQKDYMPENQTLTEGNDDQGFWALAVMAAAEYNFPHPGGDQPSWLALAQAVFNTQAPRWDDTSCGGGLRWQIYTWNKGYDYKNSISQGTFFALASRLALFTGNQSYADWAGKTWDWMEAVDFIDEKGYVYDGGHIPYNCTNIVPYQFTYNAGVFINGAAAMYNFTENKTWKERLDLLLQGSKVFFTGDDNNIMEEVACEPVDHCNIDQQSFKAYLSRWLAGITQWVPDTYDFVMPYIRASAVAAAKQCIGGSNGRMCGLKWSTGKYDGSSGVGQQMAALEVTLACMVKERDPILTSSTGGTSQSDPGAGSEDIGRNKPAWADKPVTTADRAGAAILTILVIVSMLAGAVWLFVDETSDASFLEQAKGVNFSIAAILAFLAGGAAVAKKRGSEDGDEKAAHKNQSSSPGSSSFEQNGRETPLHISRVTNRTEGHVRRASNMPIGWPNISSLRASGALVDIEKSAGTTLENVTAQQTSNTQGAVQDVAPPLADQTHVEGGAREEVQEQVESHTAAETRGQGETQAQLQHDLNPAVVTNDLEASPQNAASQPETQLGAKTEAATNEVAEADQELTPSPEASQPQTQPQPDVTVAATKDGPEAVQETTTSQPQEPPQPQLKDDVKATTKSNDLEAVQETAPSLGPVQPQPQPPKTTNETG
ncbi:unnamed protein product [Clonostachys rosea]|uniref:mannan endo-1,6-alpha-mannosidase n=1 Tax=Bionectria ochroleuca TaxID=29856 RepID=A0ABY6UGR1_BIOOC|nr:unnamed protein product [Clonostachys rosea]